MRSLVIALVMACSSVSSFAATSDSVREAPAGCYVKIGENWINANHVAGILRNDHLLFITVGSQQYRYGFKTDNDADKFSDSVVEKLRKQCGAK